jgi:DNA invertase Pin-like site-specific DNA recombinase
MRKAMLTMMVAFAQLERDTTIERTRAGLAAAAANGRKGGRPRKVDDAAAAKARSMRDKGITATDIAKMLGVSRATLYRYLADGGAAKAAAQELPAARPAQEPIGAAAPTGAPA